MWLFCVLANVVFVDCGVVIVLYEVNGIDIFVKNARVDKLLNIRIEDKFDAGSAGGTKFSWNGHQHRLLTAAFELPLEIHRCKVGEKGCNVGQFYHPLF